MLSFPTFETWKVSKPTVFILVMSQWEDHLNPYQIRFLCKRYSPSIMNTLILAPRPFNRHIELSGSFFLSFCLSTSLPPSVSPATRGSTLTTMWPVHCANLQPVPPLRLSTSSWMCRPFPTRARTTSSGSTVLKASPCSKCLIWCDHLNIIQSLLKSRTSIQFSSHLLNLLTVKLNL